MFGFLFSEGTISQIISNPLFLLIVAFQIWMLIDAVRRQEWIWALFITFFFVSAIFYYFFVFRAARAMSMAPVFEMPGAADRQRISELEDQIHHLDKAHHHSELADIYLEQGKLDQAEASYQAAMERDPEDLDTLGHYGNCLLQLKRPKEALPLLEKVVAAEPKHDYGYTLMSLAETRSALGDQDGAVATWNQVLVNHTYARARVQLAELYVEQGKNDLAKSQLQEVLQDDSHSPAFQRKKDRQWTRKAKQLFSKLKVES